LLQIYIKEDPRVFLSTPTYEECINQMPSTYTQIFVAQRFIVFKSSGRTRQHNYYNHVNQGFFWDHIANNAQFANTHCPTHPDQCEGKHAKSARIIYGLNSGLYRVLLIAHLIHIAYWVYTTIYFLFGQSHHPIQKRTLQPLRKLNFQNK
jgi:hypothetical protein